MSSATDESTGGEQSGLVRAVAGLSVHARGSVVPVLGRAQYEALRDDIAKRGVCGRRQSLAFTTVRIRVVAAGVVLDGPARVGEEGEVEFIVRAALLRRHLSAGQRGALAIELDAYEQARAEALGRSRANLRQSAEVATLPPRHAQTRDLVADWAGVSPRTIQDVIAVREGDPALFEEVKHGRLAADVAARRVRRARRDREIPAASPLTDGPFEVVYADPPWRLGNPDGSRAPENHYPTMPLGEIEALDPPVAEDALLFLWAVNSLLPEALEVMRTWGFVYRTNLVWVKPSIGTGKWTRHRHELLLLGRKGSYPAPDPEDCPDSVIDAPRRTHSEKPEAAYERIEAMYARAFKVELFARGPVRPGWASWGNQADR